VRTRAALSILIISSSGALAQPSVRLGEHDLASVFHLRKSQNRNEVHYALRLDETCRPLGDEPVLPYWRMHERGAGITEPLLRREQRAYGLARQQVRPGGEGWVVRLWLRALSRRAIEVRVREREGTCVATTWVDVDGERVRFVDAYLQLALLGVDHVRLTGSRRGEEVIERVDP